MRDRKLLARPDLQTAARLFADACRCSREHDELARKALQRYGNHGPDISGCVRDHFPEAVKAELRLVAHNVSAFSDAAWHHKPRGVRLTTMRALASAVARRDGSGFYGPRG